MATTVIPASDFVDVEISLQVPAGSPVNFQRALLLSDEPGFVAYMKANPTFGRTILIDGTAASNQLEQNARTANHDITNTLIYINTYFDQNPTPPELRVGYIDRTIASNNPAEFYWDIITEIANVTDIYHVFYVGNQAQLLDDQEGVVLSNYFDGIGGTYTPPSGTETMVTPAPRVLINHFMCGDDANFMGNVSDPPATNDLSGLLTTQSTVYTRTQLYYPDSPTGVRQDPDDPDTPGSDIAVDFYTNAFSAAIVGQLCSGSRFNRAPGALSTANITNIQSTRVVGDRQYVVGTRDGADFTPFVSPNILQVQTSASIARNLLFYVQTTSPTVAWSYRLGSCPNQALDGVPPRYTDQTIAIDWLQNEIVVEYLALIVNAGPLPFTQQGVNKVRAIIEKVFERGKRLDILNPQFGPADGEEVRIPNVEDLSPQEKQKREIGPDHPIIFVTQLSEALNFLTIRGTVQP